MPESRDLQALIASNVPVIVIETHEERRAYELIERLAIRESWPLFTWSITEGICRRDRQAQVARVPETTDPERALRHVESSLQNGVYAFFDFHPYLTDPLRVRLVKDIALAYGKTPRTLLFISHRFELPPELGRLAVRFELTMPGTDALRQLIADEARQWTARNREAVKADRNAHDLLVQHLSGLTVEDARRLVKQSIQDDGAITLEDVSRILQAKRQWLGAPELLDVQWDTVRLEDVAGLAAFKRWLEPRHAAFMDAAGTLPPPRGVLLLGVQGGGKSLAAKAVAGSWRLPLLRLDLGRLYNKYYGETERNLRDALKAVDAMAPCVLWLDEIEKGMSTGSSDDGVSRRLLGTLLTWMAERKARVFMVATANDIQSLPPELLRKGRFDEIFFVDLPNHVARQAIVAVHLKQRALDPATFDLAALADASEGFTGAEIEQAIVSGLYRASATKRPLVTSDVLGELQQTRPLSVLMAEQVAALRAWAAGRAVSAD